jgi:hypothetical protein
VLQEILTVCGKASRIVFGRFRMRSERVMLHVCGIAGEVVVSARIQLELRQGNRRSGPSPPLHDAQVYIPRRSRRLIYLLTQRE